jgi:dTMP kinase
MSRLWQVIFTLLRGVRLKANVRSQPSLLVTFSGIDGSGKTYQAQTLMVFLYFCGLKVHYFWNRAGTSIFMTLFNTAGKALLGKRIKIQGKPGVAGRRERLRNPVIRFIWSYVAAADILISYFLQVRLPLFFGRIVVCDRYIFDAAAEMECSLMPNDRLSRLAIKLMLALAPKPDFAYLLDISEETYVQRRDDTDIDYLRQQRKAYAELAQRYELRIKRTDQGTDRVTNEITSEVITPYFDNFKTWLNGIFISNPTQLNKRGWQA